jgi:hypothetical protein
MARWRCISIHSGTDGSASHRDDELQRKIREGDAFGRGDPHHVPVERETPCRDIESRVDELAG